MSLKKLIEEITQPIVEDMGGIVAGDVTIKGGSKLSKIKKMKKKGHTSVPYGSGYKKVSEAQAVKGSKVAKFITGHNLTMKGKKYKEIEFETLGVDNSSKMIKLKIIAPKNLFGMETPVKFSTIRRGPFTKTDTGKKLKEVQKTVTDKVFDKKRKSKQWTVIGHMKKKGKSTFHVRDEKTGKRFDVKLIEQKSKIKKTIGVFGGRFQPFHSGHLATYKWLSKQVDEAYITTSNIKKPPRHPMDFKEKVRHMVKVGIPKNRIVQEKTPYVADNLLKKFNPKTTAVVYAFGQKDAGRLKGGTKKDGGKTYYQDYKKSKGDIQGYEEHGYFVTAPQFGNISGTKTREMLGSPKVSEKDKKNFFKKTFGYYDKGLYIMMTNKFKKLFEFFVHIFENSAVGSVETDDGPSMFSSLSSYTKRADIEAGRLGWELSDLLVDIDNYNSQDVSYYKDTQYPNGPVDNVSFGPAGINQPSAQNLTDYVGTELWNKWLDHIDMILKNQDYEYVDNLAKERGLVVKDSPKTAKQMDDEEPENTEIRDGDDQHDELEIVKEVYSLTSDLERNGKELLLMGGAYGHMNHPFDDKELTFKDLKKIIELGLSGNLDREDNVTEKTDGQNLMISWKDGKLIAARNKGHLKNKGKTALSIKDVESKFKGRGDIRDAFVYAMRDLSKAVGALSKKQQDKVFGNGSKFMSLEVMWPASENVVNYDITELLFHGAMEYDDSGRPIGQAKDSARILQGMIKQVNQHIQKHYKISKPNFVKVPKHQDFGKMKKRFHGRLSKLQSQYALKDNDTLGLYHQRFWEEYIFNAAKQVKYKIPANVLKRLTMRWAFFDKSFSVRDMKATIKNDKFLDWALTTDKLDHARMVKDNMKPFETLFFEVGAEIMKNMDGWLAVNPAKSVQNMRKKLKSAISDVRSGGDLKKLNRLKIQLDRLNAIGGFDAIVPTEGLVFKYNGNIYKFTGAFAPINQITGLMFF